MEEVLIMGGNGSTTKTKRSTKIEGDYLVTYERTWRPGGLLQYSGGMPPIEQEISRTLTDTARNRIAAEEAARKKQEADKAAADKAAAEKAAAEKTATEKKAATEKAAIDKAEEWGGTAGAVLGGKMMGELGDYIAEQGAKKLGYKEKGQKIAKLSGGLIGGAVKGTIGGTCGSLISGEVADQVVTNLGIIFMLTLNLFS